ncbi:MAG: hypothetical protein VX294_10445 [Candidatus Latescibacterota bacterium]|nr:hypothetical protein [Candidatus Latescibacterota bacterium]
MFPLIFFSLISRIYFGISYVEDIDSLRFALSLIKFDVINLQPHFPVYPIFTWAAIILHSVSNSYLLTFSLIGAFSTIIIVICVVKIIGSKLTMPLGFFVALITFFNPLLWIMGVRYMPDLMGVAFVLLIILIFSNVKKVKCFGFIFCGLLFGVRLSYAPFIFPLLLSNYFSSDNKLRDVVLFFLGIAIWLIPLLLLTGFEDLFSAATRQTMGHFNEFGGTLSTEPDIFERGLATLRSIWADGMGLYWPGRHWLTILSSFFLLTLFILWKKDNSNTSNQNRKINPSVIIGLVFYLVWIFLFQNVVHKSRHVLPILPFVCMGIGIVIAQQWGTGRFLNRFLVCGFLFCYSAITLHIVNQHKTPTAISQVKDYLLSIHRHDLQVVTTPLIKFYLKTHEIKANLIIAGNQNELDSLYCHYQERDQTNIKSFISINNHVSGAVPKLKKTFFHNPYVNRLWPKLSVYEY